MRHLLSIFVAVSVLAACGPTQSESDIQSSHESTQHLRFQSGVIPIKSSRLLGATPGRDEFFHLELDYELKVHAAPDRQDIFNRESGYEAPPSCVTSLTYFGRSTIRIIGNATGRLIFSSSRRLDAQAWMKTYTHRESICHRHEFETFDDQTSFYDTGLYLEVADKKSIYISAFENRTTHGGAQPVINLHIDQRSFGKTVKSGGTYYLNRWTLEESSVANTVLIWDDPEISGRQSTEIHRIE